MMEMSFSRLSLQCGNRCSTAVRQGFRRRASTQTASAIAKPDLGELESSSGFAAPPESTDRYDPTAASRKRKRELPSSRYRFRPPKYYRGPLHPHQPPPPSDPASREFVPGPFTVPRLAQTHQSTVESDLMTLAYQHRTFGEAVPPTRARLRTWDDSSPYHAGRPLRGPRGGDVLRPIRKPTTFRNVPTLTRITVHTFVNEAVQESAPLHVAGMAIQAITGVRSTAHKAKANIQQWDQVRGSHVSLTSELHGETMWDFLSKCVDVVFPRIKEWKGIKGSSGDESGNITFGLGPDEVAYFPEIEITYDSYPPKLIPGCHVTLHTSANNDRDARQLLMGLGVPFYGRMKD